MAQLPTYFPIPSETALANYNWSDVRSGAGYVVFYGGTMNTSGSKILSNNVFYSQRLFSVVTNTATADQVQNDLDFDIEFGLPQNIKGDVLINVPTAIRNRETGGNYPYSTYVKCYVRKWDGSTETEIANATSETWSGTINAVNTRYIMFNLGVNVSSITHFKKGETLRITVEQHGWNTSAGGPSTNYMVGHDPQARIHYDVFKTDTISADAIDFIDSDTAIDSETTQMQVQVPFKIDI